LVVCPLFLVGSRQFPIACRVGADPITDLSRWLGHRSIEVTYGIYWHLMPSAGDRARTALDHACMDANGGWLG